MTGASHVNFDRTTARPAPFRGVLAEIWRLLCGAYLKFAGWRVEGDWPREMPKMVLVAAPHTSNFDGVNMLAAAGYYRVPLKWMGKKELVAGPFGAIVKWLGCVPVDRKGGTDLVAQMKNAFAETDEMTLAIPPEGTRAAVNEWKTGFYHIARAAGVPIVMSVLDYGTKTIRLSGALIPSGDYDADLAQIMTHYKGAEGLRGGRFRDRVSASARGRPE